MNQLIRKKNGVLALTLSTLLFSIGAFASDAGVSASSHGDARGPGGGEGEVIVPSDGSGGGCYFSYFIRKIGDKKANVHEDINYKVIVKNIGNCELRHIDVTDFLPDRTELVSAFPSPSFTHGDKVVWRNVSLDVGETEIFNVTVRVKQCELPRRFEITNVGCAWTPLIGTRICDPATTEVFNFPHPGLTSDSDALALPLQ
jgi:uncharacterized repeat protein (TIGR01451 family)